jgi:hypothetical protein
VDEADRFRQKLPRTALIETAVRRHLDAQNENDWRTHFIELPEAVALEVEAYRRVVHGPPLSNVASDAIGYFVKSRLRGNPELKDAFEAELATLRNEMKPIVSLVERRLGEIDG